MKNKNYLSHFYTTIVLLGIMTLKSFALDYTITFTGTGVSSTVDNVIVQNLTKGTTVTVTAGNVLILDVTPNSVTQLNAENENLCIYPNPSEGRSKVTFVARQEGNSLINVFGIDGKKVVGVNKNLQAGENSFLLSLPKGIFAIWVAGNGYSYSAKAISQTNGENKPEIILSNEDIKKTSIQQKSKSIVTAMPYTDGDCLLYKGISGNYSTVVTDVPTGSKTVNFDFVECKDYDGNNYSTVKIGDQVWMAENLKTTKYNTGDPINSVTDNTAWIGLHTGAYCNYDNDVTTSNKYGKLYNWYTMTTGNLNPIGWHVPSIDEWTTLENYLIANGYNYDGSTTSNLIAKSLASNKDWNTNLSVGAIGNDLTKNNSSGFTALPGGIRNDNNGYFQDIGECASWWGSSEYESGHYAAWFKGIYFSDNNSNHNGAYSSDCSRLFNYMQGGLSIRCVKDCFDDVQTITTTAPTTITATTAISGGNLIPNGGIPASGAEIIAKGVCWSKTENPTVNDSKTIDGNGTGAFTSSITGLTTGTTYYVRAYATNNLKTAYGNEISFTTASLPTLNTTVISSITSSTAMSGGSIVNDGGSTITARGVCWSTNQNPTIADNKTNDALSANAFTSSLTGLSIEITYYVRAYATNGAGTAYGSQVSFSIKLPTVSTNAVSGVTTITACFGGNVTDIGSSNVSSRGLCWSTKHDPIIALSTHSSNGSGMGLFSSSIQILFNDTVYYVRAYATNSIGTAYGNEVSFFKKPPILTTNQAFNINTTSATCNGSINSEYINSFISHGGICCSTSPSPIYNHTNSTYDANGYGNFTSSLTNLKPGTTYYVRTYALDSLGTYYGNEVSFTTQNQAPNITVTDIDGNVYHTLNIGNQVWMVENLKTTKYNDGTAIPLITDNTTWVNLTTSAFCWYNNDAANYKNTYGALYNWYAVNTGKLAPIGWHVPTDAEWTTLENYISTNLNTSVSVAKALAATTNWYSSTSIGAIGNDLAINNSSGFSALPGGDRSLSNGTFDYVGVYSSWWSSTLSNSGYPWLRILGWDLNILDKSTDYKTSGYSVRCLKD